MRCAATARHQQSTTSDVLAKRVEERKDTNSHGATVIVEAVMGRKVVAATRPGRQAALQVGQSVVGTLVVVSEAAQTTSRLARTEVEDAEVELQVARRVEMEVVGGGSGVRGGGLCGGFVGGGGVGDGGNGGA
eukprot:3559791-Prymnesium_polylepis.2